jgi:uncharacterized protein involved in exopolysaccharide biosynthesis
MDDEIDLRQYIRVLIRHWVWIVGLAAAAAAIAFAVGSLQPPTYEASALVAITGPRYRLQFDSRMQDVPFDPRVFAKGYAQLATSDDIVTALLDVANANRPPGIEPLQLRGLRGQLSANTVGDGNLVELAARDASPEAAAELANAWADRYVGHLNALYGRDQDVSALEAQVAQAKANVEATDQALAKLRREYGLGYTDQLGIAYQLQVKTRLLAEQEARAERIEQLLEEARLVAARADGAPPALVSGLLADMLGLGLMPARASGMVQIDLADMDTDASVAAIVTALEAKQSATRQAIDQLQADVATLQTEVAAQQMTLEQLLREQQVNQNTYVVLSNKLQESRIEANGDISRIAGRAAPPEVPAGRGRLFSSALAATVAGLLSAFAVLFIDYWRQGSALVPGAEAPQVG